MADIVDHGYQDNTHLGKQELDDLIEVYRGDVDKEYIKSSMASRFINFEPLVGADTKTVRRMGQSELTGIKQDQAGTTPDRTKERKFDRAQVTVDTIVLAREFLGLLPELQSDIEKKGRIAKSHGDTIGRFTDVAMFNVAIKAALSEVNAGIADGSIRGNQGRDLDDAFKSGVNADLLAVDAEQDPNALYTGIEGLITQLEENEVDISECVVVMRPTEHRVLANHDKLTDRDFSVDNGDFATGKLKMICDVPIMKSTHFLHPKVTSDIGGIMDGAQTYSLAGRELDAVACVIHPDTFLAAETIAMTSNIEWQQASLSWMIDTYKSFALGIRRADAAAALFKYQA